MTLVYLAPGVSPNEARARSILGDEERAARRARLHAAETAFETARSRREEVERRKEAALRPQRQLKARLNRLLGAIKDRIERIDEAMLAVEGDFDREWEAADDAVMAAHDAWTEELMK